MMTIRTLRRASTTLLFFGLAAAFAATDSPDALAQYPSNQYPATQKAADQASGGTFQSSPAAATHPGGGLNPLNWKLPKLNAPNFALPKLGSLLPGQAEKDRLNQRKDSLFSEVGATARNSWQRTKEAFNPQKLNPLNLFRPASTGNANATGAQSGEASKGFFGALFAPPEDPPERITDVNDFLKRQNPITTR